MDTRTVSQSKEPVMSLWIAASIAIAASAFWITRRQLIANRRPPSPLDYRAPRPRSCQRQPTVHGQHVGRI